MKPRFPRHPLALAPLLAVSACLCYGSGSSDRTASVAVNVAPSERDAACPGAQLSGPIPAAMARRLCPLAMEAAATSDAFSLIVLANLEFAIDLEFRSLAVENRLVDLGRAWSATTQGAGKRVEVYTGRVHVASVSTPVRQANPRVSWKR